MKIGLGFTALMLAALFLVVGYIIICEEGARGAAAGLPSTSVPQIYVTFAEYFVEETFGSDLEIIESIPAYSDTDTNLASVKPSGQHNLAPQIFSKNSMSVKIKEIFDALRFRDILKIIKRLLAIVRNKILNPLPFHFPLWPRGGYHDRNYDSKDNTDESKDLVIVNDHIPFDIRTIGLSKKKLEMIAEAFNAPALHNKALNEMAAQTHMEINEYLVYRYFAAVNWAPKYNSKSVEDAIVDTILWRNAFGIHKTNVEPLVPLILNGMSYTSPLPDKKGRAVLYYKMAKQLPVDDAVTYLHLMMSTVERAERLGVQFGSGEFVAIIDLKDMSFGRCPPISLIKTAVQLLKWHYPYRQGGIFMVNAGPAFSFLWQIVRPLMPKKVLKKTFFLNSKDMVATLEKEIGLDFVESSYGGKLPAGISDVEAYFQSGYWPPVRS